MPSGRDIEYPSGNRVTDYDGDTLGEDAVNGSALEGPMLVEVWHVDASAKP